MSLFLFSVATADCTGHGVPGALLSMIGHHMLDKAINVDNLECPSEILHLMSKGIEKTFSIVNGICRCEGQNTEYMRPLISFI